MKTAMILAAGRGERLRPLTWDRPKSLSQINGMPLLGFHLHQLASHGFTRVVINHAYLGGLIRRYVINQTNYDMEILFSPEPVGGLETGGGIRQALKLLGDQPFVAINADIITDFDYTSLPIISAQQAHIVLIKTTQANQTGDFGLSSSGLVLNEPKHHIFAGIACYHPNMIRQLPIGRYSIAPLLRDLADENCLTGQLFDKQWIDIGCQRRLEAAQTLFLKSPGGFDPGISALPSYGVQG